ncbi:MAG: hypothetical protein WC300_00150 [Candidatus Omnitrophota bacterium]|jgi:hypothetical protein
MNKDIISVAVFGALCVIAGVLIGAGIAAKPDLVCRAPIRFESTQKAKQAMWQYPHGMRLASKRGEDGLFMMLVTRLELSRDQQSQVTTILERTRQEISAIGQDTHAAIKAVKDRSDKEIMDILNPQQRAEFSRLLKEFGKRRRRPVCPGADNAPAA